MKCVKSKQTGEITKVSNERAEELVEVKSTHTYCPRKEWKVNVRDFKKSE